MEIELPGATILLSVNSAWNVFNFRMPLVDGLIAAGYRVVVAAPADGYEQRLVEHGVEYVDLPIDQRGTSPIGDGRLLMRYRAVLRRVRADCFLSFTVKPNIYGSLAARSLGVPSINNVSGLGTAFIRKNLLTRIVTSLSRQALRHSSTVFFQNPDDLALFRTLKLVREAQARLLPGSGVDLNRFAATPLPGNDSPIFLYIGRLLWDKGLGELAEASLILKQRGVNARIRLLGLLGANNPTAIPEEIVKAWVADSLVEYVGHTDDVRPFIAEADCIVLPSYREGLPRTLLEAAAMGRPMVATDVPGCREIARAGENALLCIARDATSLANELQRFARLSRGDREALGRNSRAIAQKDYSTELVVECYLAAVEDALG